MTAALDPSASRVTHPVKLIILNPNHFWKMRKTMLVVSTPWNGWLCFWHWWLGWDDRCKNDSYPSRYQSIVRGVCMCVSVCACEWVYLSSQSLTGLPQWFSGKESTCNAGNMDSIPGSRRSPGGRHGNPLQYPGPENPMNRGGWWATIHL